MVSNITDSLSQYDYTKFLEELQAGFSWEWDSRFKTVLAQISVKDKNAVEKILVNYLGTAWDSVTIKKAPESEQRILESLGGMMSGQFFYAAGLPENGIIFCAWWPWGNGHTISIRLGTSQAGSGLLATLACPTPDNVLPYE